MATWVWIVIVVAVLLAVLVVAWRALATRRTRSLKEQFGQEYDRTADTAGSRRKAEAELEARQERRAQLHIRPLSGESRARYSRQWETVQGQFVDSPQGSLASADALVSAVMSERGYPMDEFEQRAADISVDHPRVVDHYRGAHEVFARANRGQASTEDLRQAMQHYRALFDELLVGSTADRGAAGSADRPAVESETAVRS
jgi:hypothetical protein